MKCPGQDSRYWKFDDIFEAECPECGTELEFFKTDTTRKCTNCGHRFLNPNMDFGCASHCQYAEQCLGDMPPELLAQRDNLLKDRVAIEMKRYFGSDFKRIGHAGRVARYAESLARDLGGNLAVILPVSYLHDIGIKEAEKQHNSSASRYQEELGPPIAKEMLTKLGAKVELIEEVADIIAHHHSPGDEESLNFKILYDADLISNLYDSFKEREIENGKRQESIAKAKFLTEEGRVLAEKELAA